MRLLNAHSRKLKEFMSDNDVPQYAILSHTWGEDEVSCQDMVAALGPHLSLKRKAGYVKIIYCCGQAIKDGLDWVWIDT